MGNVTGYGQAGIGGVFGVGVVGFSGVGELR